MTNAPTTRETADHAELARLADAAKADGNGKWIDASCCSKTERTVEVWRADDVESVVCVLDRRPWDGTHAPDTALAYQDFIAAANPATVLALLSEIAALRGALAEAERYASSWARCAGEVVTIGESWKERFVQAERQRDEAVGLLRKLTDRVKFTEGEGGRRSWSGISVEFVRAFDQARAFLANQGADQ